MATERLILKGTIANLVEIRNMFTCSVVPSGGDTSAVLWAGYWSSLEVQYEGISHFGVHFYEYEVQAFIGGSWVPQDVVALNLDGVQTGDVLPFQNAIVFIAKAAGLRAVGRKFLAGIPEANTNSGVLAGSMISAAANFLAAYITPFTGIGGGTITPGILDKTGTFRPFVGGFVSSLLGSMRRRKPGLGI